MKLSSHSTLVTDIATILNLLGSPLKVVYDSWDKPLKLHCRRLADMSLLSGKIIASDGIIPDGAPFNQTVNPGTYPLLLIIADLDGDERVAFAMLRFSEEPVARWEVATIDYPADLADKLISINSDLIFSYGVDSGTGCFADANAYPLLFSDEAIPPDLMEKIEKEQKKIYKDTRDWVHIETPKGSMAIFSSGDGDGTYASYFGLNRAGKPVALLTDFVIVDWPNRPQR